MTKAGKQPKSEAIGATMAKKPAKRKAPAKDQVKPLSKPKAPSKAQVKNATKPRAQASTENKKTPGPTVSIASKTPTSSPTLQPTEELARPEAAISKAPAKIQAVTATKPQLKVAYSTRTRAPEDLKERIRRRAYELWEERGRGDGHAIDDWLAAEQEILVIISKSVDPQPNETKDGRPRKRVG